MVVLIKLLRWREVSYLYAQRSINCDFVGAWSGLSIGIGANGCYCPALGQVPASLLASIEADIEASGDITGVSSAEDATMPDIDGDQNEEDVPSKKN